MPLSSAAEEARRVMTFCNACRYCEGFCAVFPAMERRRTFGESDLHYLANLCHNCRDCYYACQYAPPHEFALNIPKTMAGLRLETYRDYCWPGVFRGFFKRNGLFLILTTILCLGVILGGVRWLQPAEVVFSRHTGSGAFYRVIPYSILVAVPAIMTIYMLVALAKTFWTAWRKSGGRSADLMNPRAHAVAVYDVLRLKYLDGGGGGCNYPGEQFSMARRWLHHLVFYGFGACFAATTFAAFYEHFLHITAPFAIFSLPVILGTVGGIAIVIGTSGLLYLKTRLDKAPTADGFTSMDVGFLLLLLMTSLSGLALLVFRETAAMGMLLAIHLAFVAAFFLTAPYGKFVHAILRYAALVKNAAEEMDS